jgi:ribonucleoside-diphosphate reductase beta chain
MQTEHVRTLEEIQHIRRTYNDFASPKGLRTDILPWRLWDKAKKLMWDPADLDFSQDAKDWAGLDDEHRYALIGLARGFMIGEEGVTLDILPLVMAMADEGRAEETMYLTTFAFEEAKHIEFFRRWFDALGVDFAEVDPIMRKRMRERGVRVPEPDEPRDGLFERELPRVMRRLLTDRSPQAFLDAGVTYNQFIEGCLAIAGYRVWSGMFSRFGILPGLQEGLALVQRDERRHIAYGTYLCRRLIAAHPELFEFAKERMYELRDDMTGQPRPQEPSGNGDGNGDGGYGAGAQNQVVFGPFLEHAVAQVERRIQVLEKARSLSADEAESGTGAEEAEAELESV